MKTPVLILSGSDYEYHICDTVSETLTALRQECEKFVSPKTWSSDPKIDFPDKETAVDWLFGNCLSNGDFGDVCQIIKLKGPAPDGGEFYPSIWD